LYIEQVAQNVISLGETLGAGTCASVAWAAHRAEDGPVLVTNVDLHGQCFAAVVAGGEP